MSRPVTKVRLVPAVLALAGALALSGCMMAEPVGLAPGLTARMDTPGAALDRTQALGMLNSFRATTGAPPLAADAALDTEAQALASLYASTGNAPQKPASALHIRVSGGYANFAETFSGWRNSPSDAAALLDPQAHRAGLGVTYDANSAYGVYWVLLLAP